MANIYTDADSFGAPYGIFLFLTFGLRVSRIPKIQCQFAERTQMGLCKNWEYFQFHQTLTMKLLLQHHFLVTELQLNASF